MFATASILIALAATFPVRLAGDHSLGGGAGLSRPAVAMCAIVAARQLSLNRS